MGAAGASTGAALDWTQPFAELAGRRVLVTGASRGIGAAVVQAFAQCGAIVAVHYGAAAAAAGAIVEAIRARGGTALALGADLTRPGAGRALVRDAVAGLGGLDVLVTNAGSPGPRSAFDELAEARYDEIMQLNLHAVSEAIREAIPVLRRSGRAAIINTTSVGARTGGGRGVATYAAAKAAVETMTRALAKELAPQGIRVNCVSPGYIDTDIHSGFSTAADLAAYVAATPMARAGRVEECVGAYLFLAAERLSSYVTGQTLSVNGGLVMP